MMLDQALGGGHQGLKECCEGRNSASWAMQALGKRAASFLGRANLVSQTYFLEDSSVLCVKGVLCPQVMHALRELTGSLSVLIEMVVYCCFCNEHFSFTVLHFIKVHTKPGQACVPLVFLSSFGHPVSCNSTTEQSAQWVGFGGGVGV